MSVLDTLLRTFHLGGRHDQKKHGRRGPGYEQASFTGDVAVVRIGHNGGQVAPLDSEISLLGRGLTRREWGLLSGCPDGGSVTVKEATAHFQALGKDPSSVGDFSHGGLFVKVDHPKVLDGQFVIEKTTKSYLSAHVTPPTTTITHVLAYAGEGSQGSGVVFQGVATMLRHAWGLGVKRVQIEASGSGTDIGYYTWPKLGFNARLKPDVRDDMPERLPEAGTLLQLYRHPASRAWWKANGDTTNMEFDLMPGSASWQAFNAFASETRAGRLLASVELPVAGTMTFHLGGRHDQKKHGRRGPGSAGIPQIDMGPEITLRDAARQPNGSVWLAPSGAFHSASGLHSASASRALGRVGIRMPPNDRATLRVQMDYGMVRMQIRARHDAEWHSSLSVGADIARRPTMRQMDVMEVLAGRSPAGFYWEIGAKPGPGDPRPRRRLAQGQGFSAFRNSVNEVFGPEEASEPYSFHLGGRHDQKKHGRRGPGAPRFTYTGDLTVDRGAGFMSRDQIRARENVLFGRELTKLEVQRLTGTPDGGRVDMSPLGRGIGFAMTHPASPRDYNTFNFEKDDNLGSYLSGFNVHAPHSSPLGVSAQGVRGMFSQARALGAKSVYISAAGEWGSSYTGYYTWPKLGFDSALPPFLRGNAPGGARSVLELYRTQEGRTWWKRHGQGLTMTFDLQEGSKSWQALDHYMANSRLGRSLEASEPQAFHLGGRHDQKKHGRRGPGYEMGGAFTFTGRAQAFFVALGSGAPLSLRDSEVTEVCHNLFGRTPTPLEWQRLAGAPDDAAFTISFSGPRTLYVDTRRTGITSAHFWVSKDLDGKTAMDNIGLFADAGARQGLALRGAAVSLRQARELGVSYVSTSAVGRWGSRNTGYYTWPKLGFDGPIRTSFLAPPLPIQFSSARTVLDLYAMPGGKAWFKRHGASSHYTFDLKPGSRSWAVLDRLMASRDWQTSTEATEPAAFHLAGRHDQKKHGRRGVGAQAYSYTGRVDLEFNEMAEDAMDYLGLAGTSRLSWQRLTGTPDGGRIQMDSDWHDLDIHGYHPSLPGVRSHIVVDRGSQFGGLRLTEIGLFIRNQRSPGASLQGANVMFREAKALGFKSVEVQAYGARNYRSHAASGYYTWPKLGFNARLDYDERAALPSHLGSAQTLLDLYSMPGGKNWWKAHGATKEVVFDLREGSKSWGAFNAYMESSRLGRLLESTETLIFHLLGKHDQKKHGRRGVGYSREALTYTGNVTVRVLDRDWMNIDLAHRDVRQVSQNLFGRQLSIFEWQRLSGCPDGGRMTMGIHGPEHISLAASYPGVRDAHFYVTRDPDDGRVRLGGISLFLEPGSQTSGIGIRGAVTTLRTARDLGVSYARTMAVGRWGERHTGYYTWPKLGFDGVIRSDLWDRMPSELRGARYLLDLYALPGGRKWWKRNGSGTLVEFDLAPGSRSWDVMDRLMGSRDFEALGASEPYAFHLGGRHDQKMHGRRGPGADGNWNFGREIEPKDVRNQAWLDRAGRFHHVPVEHWADADRMLRENQRWDPMVDDVKNFMSRSGAMRIHLFSGGRYSGPTLNVQFTRKPTSDQVIGLMKLSSANPEHRLDWQHSPLAGRGENDWDMEGFLDYVDRMDFSEPYPFHLAGRHDQLTHGRRGPGGRVGNMLGRPIREEAPMGRSGVDALARTSPWEIGSLMRGRAPLEAKAVLATLQAERGWTARPRLGGKAAVDEEFARGGREFYLADTKGARGIAAVRDGLAPDRRTFYATGLYAVTGPPGHGLAWAQGHTLGVPGGVGRLVMPATARVGRLETLREAMRSDALYEAAALGNRGGRARGVYDLVFTDVGLYGAWKGYDVVVGAAHRSGVSEAFILNRGKAIMEVGE